MRNPPLEPPIAMRCYSRFLHAFPMVKSGLTRLSFNRVTNRQFAQCSDPVMAKLLNGMRIEVSPNDYHGRILYLFGTNDPKVHLTARGLLREGDVFLDIGANYSSIGLSAAKWVGSAGRVHLFEPQKSICDPVEAAIRRSGLANIELHRVALLDRDDVMVMSRPKYHSGMATIVDYGADRSDWDSESVPVRNVATYVEPLIRGRPFGVKLDIEGAEPAIMPWILAQPNLRFLIFEAAHNHGQLWELIRSAGLTLFGLCRNVLRCRIRPIASLAAMSSHHDVVAIRLPATVGTIKEMSPQALGRLMGSG